MSTTCSRWDFNSPAGRRHSALTDALGFTYNRTRVEEGTFKGKDILLFNAVQVIANILAWALIAPAGDVVIFKEVPSVVFLQGISSAINNCISTGVIGTLLLVAYAATKTKKGSLSKKNG